MNKGNWIIELGGRFDVDVLAVGRGTKEEFEAAFREAVLPPKDEFDSEDEYKEYLDKYGNDIGIVAVAGIHIHKAFYDEYEGTWIGDIEEINK